MRESFVFHADFIDHLPEELKTEWAMYCINYGLFDIEPQFDNVLIAELWRKLKTRIDTDKDSYNKRVEYQKAYYERKKNNSTVKNIENVDNVENVKNFDNVYPYTESRREYDYESESVYESEFDSESEYESVSDNNSLIKDAPSTVNYSKIIFELFRDANLPCARNNEISFLQTDFTNAMNHLHKTPEFAHIHSDDVIGAVKNYIEVLLNPDCYVSTKMNFLQFVKSKLFYNLLPANYDLNNYLHFDAVKSDKKSDDDKFKDYDKKYISSPCKKCNGKRIFLNPNINQWICDDCFAMYPFSSYKGD